VPQPRPAAANRPTPPAKQAAPNRRVLAVQRALAEFGYGQVTPNGVLGTETKAAIERFERERKLPVTGQVSDRLTRELAAVTGRPLE
jgi:peptidoglycan hydrolase-like protein with peptidoglycan-binding domain